MRVRNLVWMGVLAAGACVGQVDPGGGRRGEGDVASGGAGNPARPPGTNETPGVQPGTTPTAPGGTTSPAAPLTCDPNVRAATPPRLRRLTAPQWNETVAALLGTASTTAGRVNPFDDGLNNARFSTDVTRVSVPAPSLSLLLDAAESLAAELAPRLRAETTCLGAARPDRACLEGVITAVGARAFRRPLTAEEVGRYAGLALSEQAAEGADGSLRLALAALLASPHFAFRWERGGGMPDAAGRVRLTSYELASAISYTLLDAPPDAALLAAAQGNQLQTPAQIRAHVDRLLGAGGSTVAVLRFLQEYFKYPLGSAIAKDPKLFPGHRGPELVEDTHAFIRHALEARRGFLDTLLASPAGFARAETAGTYGVTTTARGPELVAFPPGQRAGILTQPSFLVAFSDANQSHPVHRGRFISENVLCQPVPDLPLSEVPPLSTAPDATARQKLKVHSADPRCAGCHALMDPFGLALEQYDHAGRFRATGEDGKPMDASGVLAGAGEADGPFSGPVELAGRLARSPVVRACFVRQAFRYFLGREATARDGCVLKEAEAAFVAAQADAAALFTALLTSDAFLYRSPN